jgi:hypothetical protein
MIYLSWIYSISTADAVHRHLFGGDLRLAVVSNFSTLVRLADIFDVNITVAALHIGRPISQVSGAQVF